MVDGFILVFVQFSRLLLQRQVWVRLPLSHRCYVSAKHRAVVLAIQLRWQYLYGFAPPQVRVWEQWIPQDFTLRHARHLEAD
jgi:hypothetical protein